MKLSILRLTKSKKNGMIADYILILHSSNGKIEKKEIGFNPDDNLISTNEIIKYLASILVKVNQIDIDFSLPRGLPMLIIKENDILYHHELSDFWQKSIVENVFSQIGKSKRPELSQENDYPQG